MRDPFVVLMACLSAVCLGVMGWVFAHGTVATECEKLGTFYVGDRVFECKLKAKNT